MITYEWEIRGFGVIRTCKTPGRLDERVAIPFSDLPDSWREIIARRNFGGYGRSAAGATHPQTTDHKP